MIDSRKQAGLGSRRSIGFTLIELAIVLSIIGILSSTAGVQYFKMLERARIARTIVELRGIAAELDPMGDDNAVLPGSLGEVGAGHNDPWGRPYQYLLIQGQLPGGLGATKGELPHVAAGQGQGGESGGGGSPAIALARKDRFLVPINSDYDLYSVGPDGETHATLNNPVSRDDIIRAADGGFYGLAEKF